MGFIHIRGLQVHLRDWRLEDVEPYRLWQKPGHLWQSLDGPYYRGSGDESHRLADELRAKIIKADFSLPRLRLVVADAATEALLGTVSSYWESKETEWLCVGISLYDSSRWGQGLGKEALGLWMDYLFQSHPQIVRLDMRTWSGNLGLIRLAKKLGFTQEACFR